MLSDENFSLKDSLRQAQNNITNLSLEIQKFQKEKQVEIMERDNLNILITKLKNDLDYKEKQIENCFQTENFIEESKEDLKKVF